MPQRQVMSPTAPDGTATGCVPPVANRRRAPTGRGAPQHSRGRGRPGPACRTRSVLIALLATTLVAVAATNALADPVPGLTRALREAKHTKARINAAASLGRLSDPRGVEPLMAALRHDDSEIVRAVAAAALGSIGDRRALKVLRQAYNDRDQTVRTHARTAVRAIRRARRNSAQQSRIEAQSPEVKPPIRVAPRERPVLDEPILFVELKSVNDKSLEQPGKPRRGRAEPPSWAAATLRDFMMAELRRAKQVTVESARANDLNLRKFVVDATIISLHRQRRGPWIEIACAMRLAISNERGRMLSVLTGGAAVQVPHQSFRREYERQMRLEALENAAKNMHQDLMTYLARQAKL
jgi:hypothetical protein